MFEQALISLVESCEQEYAVLDVCHVKVLTIPNKVKRLREFLHLHSFLFIIKNVVFSGQA